MRKELNELRGCLCIQENNTEVYIDNGDYTYIEAIKDKYGLRIRAWGEGTADFRPTFCPFCGRKLK